MNNQDHKKISKGIDSYYKRKDETIVNYSTDDSELLSVLKNAEEGIVYDTPTNMELSELDKIKNELIELKEEMNNALDPKKILELGAEGDNLQRKKEIMQMEIQRKENNMRIATNCLSKARQCQSFYDNRSQFLKSAE